MAIKILPGLKTDLLLVFGFVVFVFRTAHISPLPTQLIPITQNKKAIFTFPVFLPKLFLGIVE